MKNMRGESWIVNLMSFMFLLSNPFPNKIRP
jgi:hypothetical protein